MRTTSQDAVAAGDDLLWRALADPTRRRLLDLLRAGHATVGALAARFDDLTRFAVRKHLAVLEEAGLVVAQKVGRERWCRVNAAPLLAVCLRWLRPFEIAVASRALRIKEVAERGAGAAPRAHTSPPYS
jgi:DNA-binding transcriptional ArsR family regulator